MDSYKIVVHVVNCERRHMVLNLAGEGIRQPSELAAYRAEMASPTTDIQDFSGTGESQRQSTARLPKDLESAEQVCGEALFEKRRDREEVQENGSVASGMGGSIPHESYCC
jgi:hypothetical protein